MNGDSSEGMFYYFSTIIGSGTRADPCRPQGSDGQPAPWGMIDLRPTGTELGGFCILALSVRNDQAGMEFLGEDFSATPSAAARNRIQNKLGITFNRDDTYAGLIRQLLHPVEGIADNVRWKPIVMTLAKRWQAFLCGQAIFDEAAVGGGVTDNFNRANETPVASPWITIPTSITDIRLNTNALNKGATNDAFAYYNGAASSPNQYSQFLYLSDSSGTDDWGPAVRISGTTSVRSGYWMDQRGFGANKYVADVFTVVEALTFTTATGSTFRTEVSGSTITCKKNGAEVTGSPSTDTSLTTGQPGVFLFEAGISVDNFDGGDLVGPSPSFAGYNRLNRSYRPRPFGPGIAR